MHRWANSNSSDGGYVEDASEREGSETESGGPNSAVNEEAAAGGTE